jgi:hypothetical protein
MPTPGFLPQRGACRDASGFQGRHLAASEQNFSVCKAKCDELGARCDAFDLDGVAPPVGSKPQPRYRWCGIWGSTLTPADAPAGGVWTYACNGDCPLHNTTQVCRGDVAVGASNTCFPKQRCKSDDEASIIADPLDDVLAKARVVSGGARYPKVEF